jgi:hypothetical protein
MLNGQGPIEQRRWSETVHLRLADNHSLGKREILFVKIEDDIIDAQIAKLGSSCLSGCFS